MGEQTKQEQPQEQPQEQEQPQTPRVRIIRMGDGNGTRILARLGDITQQTKESRESLKLHGKVGADGKSQATIGKSSGKGSGAPTASAEIGPDATAALLAGLACKSTKDAGYRTWRSDLLDEQQRDPLLFVAFLLPSAPATGKGAVGTVTADESDTLAAFLSDGTLPESAAE